MVLTMPAGTGLPSSNCVSCFLYLSVSGGNIVRGSTTFGPSSNTVRAFEHSAKVLKPTRRPMPLWLTPPNGRYGLVPDCTTLWLGTMQIGRTAWRERRVKDVFDLGVALLFKKTKR